MATVDSTKGTVAMLVRTMATEVIEETMVITTKTGLLPVPLPAIMKAEEMEPTIVVELLTATVYRPVYVGEILLAEPTGSN